MNSYPTKPGNIGIEVTQLTEISQKRWFKTSELLHILNNIPLFLSLGLKLHPNAELAKPPSGALLVFEVKKGKREWKKDGYDWIKRKDQIHVREDAEKLRYCGKPIIYCTYTSGTGFHDTPASMKKRTYWLLDNPHYILVHYLNEQSSSKPSESFSEAFVEEKSCPLLEALDLDNFSLKSGHDQLMEELNSDFFFCDNPPADSRLDPSKSHLFSSHENSEIGASFIPEALESSAKTEITDLQTQVRELQNRMSSYEKMLDKIVLPPAPFVESSRVSVDFLKSLNMEIVDFSPEWDFTAGGTKVLICLNPSLEQYRPLLGVDSLKVRFDTTEVPATFLQGTVLKCNSPSHPTGFALIGISFLGQIIALAKAGNVNRMFEYRDQKKKKKKKSINFLRTRPESENSEKEIRECKVRAIECLCCMEKRLGISSMECHDSNESLLPKNIETMKDQELEDFTKSMFLKICLLLIHKIRKQFSVEECAKIIDKKDKYGCALVHYVSALDYFELIEIFHSLRVDLNILTDNGLSPLVISAARGNKRTLSNLLQYTSISYEEEKAPKRRTIDPMKIAIENRQHNIVEMLLREMSLQDAFKSEADEYAEKYKKPTEMKRKIEMRSNPRTMRFQACNDDLEISTSKLRFQNYPERRGNSECSRQNSNQYGLHSGEFVGLVQKIQRNVRGWLLRRHYRDIKSASKALHSTLQTNIFKKKINEKSAAIIIQRTVRAWLNVKNEISS